MPTLVGKSVNDPWEGATMVHDDRTYLDDEGLEYVSQGYDDEANADASVPMSPEGKLWGAHELYGGYDAE